MANRENMTRAEMNARIIELLEQRGLIPPEQPQSYAGATDDELTELCLDALDRLGLVSDSRKPGDSA